MTRRRTFGIIPTAVFYRHRKATPLGKAFSGFWARWASLGLPPWRQVALELTGRKTGRPHRTAMVVARYEGESYLVSMLGECEWVRNARAHPAATIIGRRRRPATLEEVPVAARAPIIQQYLRVAVGARPHMGLGKTASLTECARIAPDHPVFRIRDRDASE